MRKIHTRTKRRYGLGTHLNPYYLFHPKAKRHRPKTFKTEKAAHAWALKNKLKEGQYQLEKVKRGKKFQIEIKK